MVDLAAIAKWPDVPACYGWLSLDRRGDWRLQGERVTHRGLIDFINRQYAGDETGCWFLQNGPQRVFVSLTATPWIYRNDGDRLASHTGQPAGALHAAYLDRDGNVFLHAELGIGLLDDRDLATFLAECCDSAGQPADEAAFAALLSGTPADIFWCGLPLLPASLDELAARFRFIRQPAP